MTDVTTGQRLRVSTDGGGAPYIQLPFSQLDDVVKPLTKHQLYHWVQANVISWNGGPATAIINLGRNANVASVQCALDDAH